MNSSQYSKRKNFAVCLLALAATTLTLSKTAMAKGASGAPPKQMGQKAAVKPAAPKEQPAQKPPQGAVQKYTSTDRRGLSPEQAKAKEQELSQKLSPSQLKHVDTKPGHHNMYTTNGGSVPHPQSANTLAPAPKGGAGNPILDRSGQRRGGTPEQAAAAEKMLQDYKDGKK